MNTTIWICFFLALWAGSIAITYYGAWNRGKAAGINWARVQIYGEEAPKRKG